MSGINHTVHLSDCSPMNLILDGGKRLDTPRKEGILEHVWINLAAGFKRRSTIQKQKIWCAILFSVGAENSLNVTASR